MYEGRLFYVDNSFASDETKSGVGGDVCKTYNKLHEGLLGDDEAF